MAKHQPMKSADRLADWKAVLAISVATLLYLYLFSGLSEVNINRPIVFQGDVITAYFYSHNAALYGGAYANPNIGFPFPQELFLFPQRDPIGGYAQGVLGLFTDSGFLILNLYTILCFVASALAFFVSAKVLQAPRWVAAAAAVCFGFVAYTNVALDHSVLMPVAAVPMGVVVAVLVSKAGELSKREKWFIALSALLIGATIPYWAFFTCALLAVLATMMAVGRKSLRPLLRAGLTVSGVIGGFMLGWAPVLIKTALAGYASTAGAKTSHQQHLLGLNFLDMLVPKSTDLWGLSKLSTVFADDRLPYTGHIEVFIGLAGAAGLLLILVQLSRGAAGRLSGMSEAQRHLTVLMFIALLLSAAGGLFYVFGATVTPLFRASFRMSVVITAIALLALVLWTKGMPKWVKTGAVALCLLSAWERASTLEWADLQEQTLASAEYNSHREVCFQSRASLPAGTAVLQLPPLPYWDGELPMHNFHIYSHLACPIFAPDLKWSFGSIAKSPQGEFFRYLGTRPIADLIELAPRLGYGAVLVDHRAYPDNGAEIISALKTAGDVVATSSMQTTVKLRETPALEPLLPVVVDYRQLGFSELEQDGDNVWRWNSTRHRAAGVNICNYRNGDMRIHLGGSLLAEGADGWATIDSDFFNWSGHTGQKFSGDAVLTPGCHKLWFRGEAPKIRLLNFTVSDNFDRSTVNGPSLWYVN